MNTQSHSRPPSPPVILRKIISDVYVGGEPAPAFEYHLNRILTSTRKQAQADFRAHGYRSKVAREARVGHSTVCRYFAGEPIGFETQKRIRAAIRRIDARG